jgi:acyl-CoA reductase-like NAD-dependent aldehyde dehydrogenase
MNEPNELPRFPAMTVGDSAPAGHMTVTAPYDDAPIAEVALSGPDAVAQALEAAHALFRDRRQWLPKRERIVILKRAIGLMEQRAEALALEAAHEGGKPLIDSRVEVARAIDSLQVCVDCLRTETGGTVPMGLNEASKERLAFITREPVGVVVAVSAFNHPLNLIAHQIGPAIAAGCPVIVKPAQDTPLSCFRLVGMLREAGLPEAWCQALVTDNRETATQLVTDPRVGFFSFIGSPGVGWSLRAQLAPGTRCALEHGGAAPVIVAEDADLDAMLPKLLKGGFYHAGQVCVSVQRVFAPRAIARDLAQRLAEGAAGLEVGDPTKESTDIGPLIRPAETRRVADWVNEAVEAGAERLAGGDALSDSLYPATVLYDPPADAKVSRREIFGPVICVYPWDDLDQAIARANALPYAFQAAVFTRDLDLALRVSHRLDASAVMVNDHTAFRVDWMPFAGLRESGLGTGGIPWTFHDMQVEKMLVVHSNAIEE